MHHYQNIQNHGLIQFFSSLTKFLNNFGNVYDNRMVRKLGGRRLDTMVDNGGGVGRREKEEEETKKSKNVQYLNFSCAQEQCNTHNMTTQQKVSK